jgi:hypothetical protein
VLDRRGAADPGEEVVADVSATAVTPESVESPEPSKTRVRMEKLSSRSSLRSPNSGASSGTRKSLCRMRGRRSISFSRSREMEAACETKLFGVNLSER